MNILYDMRVVGVVSQCEMSMDVCNTGNGTEHCRKTLEKRHERVKEVGMRAHSPQLLVLD
jgi:hypothetical protein